MREQGSWRVVLAMAVAVVPLGCRTVPLPHENKSELISQLVPPADGSRPSEDKDLPPKEAAKLCSAAGGELAKGGDELHAIFEYEKARKYDPDIKVSRRLAVLYDRLGDFQKAQEEYHKALKENPRDADLLNDMGYGYYTRGRWIEAEKYLRRAVEVKPKHARAAMNLALCVGAQGRFDEALQLFEKAVSPAQARCNLAFVLTTQHKWPEARRVYQEALQLDPDIPLARAALAKLDEAQNESSKETVIRQASYEETPNPAEQSCVPAARP